MQAPAVLRIHLPGARDSLSLCAGVSCSRMLWQEVPGKDTVDSLARSLDVAVLLLVSTQARLGLSAFAHVFVVYVVWRKFNACRSVGRVIRQAARGQARIGTPNDARQRGHIQVWLLHGDRPKLQKPVS